MVGISFGGLWRETPPLPVSFIQLLVDSRLDIHVYILSSSSSSSAKPTTRVKFFPESKTDDSIKEVEALSLPSYKDVEQHFREKEGHRLTVLPQYNYRKATITNC